MDSEEYVFDTVKFEKMKAMARYNRFRKIKNLLVVVEVLVALTLISWSSTYLPQAVKVSGDFFFRIADYVFKPHVIFLIGNSIIVALVVLCRETDGGNNQHSGTGDLYEDYSHYSHRKVVSVPEEKKNSPTSPETTKTISAGDVQEKQIVYMAPPPVEEKLIQTEVKQIKVEEEEKSSAVATAVEDATKEIQKFQRTQSVRLKREIAVMPRLQLRRSETYRHNATASLDSVDNLSNEEFNLTVAAFIKRHQEFLLQQKLEEKEGF